MAIAACGAPTATPTPGAGSPAAVLAASAAALNRVSSFHVSGMYDPGLSLDLVVSGGDVQGTVSFHGITWQVIGIAGHPYIRGSALWQATEPAHAAAFGDGWVSVDDATAAYNTAGLTANIRRALVIIVFGSHRGLVDHGSVTVGGRAAVELRTATDIYDIATDASHDPLRWFDTDIPGPNGAPCGVTLDGFGANVAPITAPAPTATLAAPG